MASTEAFAELDRVRKALKHARIKRDRVPRGDAEGTRRAEEKVAALEARRDELYEQHGRRTAKKLEDAQADHEGGAAAVRRAIAMLQTGLSRMEGAQRDTVAAASAAYPSGPTATPASPTVLTGPACENSMGPEDDRVCDAVHGEQPPALDRLAKRKAPASAVEPPVPEPAKRVRAVPPPRTDHVLCLQGPELLDLMVKGEKLIDNQKIQLETGQWYVVKIGMNRKWRTLPWACKGKLAPLVSQLEHKQDLEGWHGCAAALLYFAECRPEAECNGYAWAAGPYCYVVAASVVLKTPVKIAPHGQALKWPLSPEERHLVLEQLPEQITYHDLSALG